MHTYFYMLFPLTAERPRVVDERDCGGMMNRRDITNCLRQTVHTAETTQAAGLRKQSNTIGTISKDLNYNND